MHKIVRDREEGQRYAGPLFKGEVYRSSLPYMRKTGTLEMHTGCVNHISFSESGAPQVSFLQRYMQEDAPVISAEVQIACSGCF